MYVVFQSFSGCSKSYAQHFVFMSRSARKASRLSSCRFLLGSSPLPWSAPTRGFGWLPVAAMDAHRSRACMRSASQGYSKDTHCRVRGTQFRTESIATCFRPPWTATVTAEVLSALSSFGFDGDSRGSMGRAISSGSFARLATGMGDHKSILASNGSRSSNVPCHMAMNHRENFVSSSSELDWPEDSRLLCSERLGVWGGRPRAQSGAPAFDSRPVRVTQGENCGRRR
ncbi:hypothetical protein OF83DRAFT_390200 [Amylostereum chailletii]|nr:hypothetical protein OF83DRAFT_390200 [Amylostereum chailletii]